MGKIGVKQIKKDLMIFELKIDNFWEVENKILNRIFTYLMFLEWAHYME